jgi:uncharacterized protein (TIGR00730 family)
MSFSPQNTPLLLTETAHAMLTDNQFELVNRVANEYIHGFSVRDKIAKPVLTIYGSARLQPDDQDYQDIETLSRIMRDTGWVSVSGGGPGIMKAALDNDIENQLDTAYYGIDINHEKDKSHADISYTFSNFGVRKHFLRASQAFVVAPGGFGTMDEFFELLTLIQTKKADPAPIILYNESYYGGLVDWVRDQMVRRGTVSPQDVDLFQVFSDPHEAAAYLLKVTDYAA